jgi:hypothetical protein
MDQLQLIFEESPWWILASIVLGAGYAWLLYQKKGPWSSTTNKILAGLRGFLVALLAFFLINPLLKQTISQIEDPIYVLAVDNSASVLGVDDDPAALKSSLKSVIDGMDATTNQVDVYTFDGKLSPNDFDSLKFDSKSTHLSRMLKSIESDYEGRNLAGVVLASDGIFNQGLSPQYSNYTFPIHTVGIGDTIPKRDVKIKNLYYNKIAYLGNKFPLVVELQNDGIQGEPTSISIIQNGQLLATETVDLTSDNTVFSTEFNLDANTAGFQRYQVVVGEVPNELTTANNSQDAYLEIIDGKEKILMIGFAPHPDMKAINSALSKNENYEITQYIPGVDDFEVDQYDLIIINEAFDRFNLLKPIFDQVLQYKASILVILGNRSNFELYNETFDLAKFEAKAGQRDRVSPSYNEDFSYFTFDQENQSVLNSYPPITVPYGEFSVHPETEVLFYQKVGSIETTKPLMMVRNTQDRKVGVIIGEGFWQWRLQEYAQYESTEVFDQFISKTVQYLSTKEDKRKFRLYPEKNEYFDTEPVVFEAEIYNNIYESVYGFEITLEVKDEDGNINQYSLINSESNSRLTVGQLSPGIYQYEAYTILDGKREAISGELSVQELQLESISLTAQHQLLRTVSENTGGEFFQLSDIESIPGFLAQQEAKGIVYSTESFESLINLRWIFFILLALVSTEWFIRKYSGSY